VAAEAMAAKQVLLGKPVLLILAVAVVVAQTRDTTAAPASSSFATHFKEFM